MITESSVALKYLLPGFVEIPTLKFPGRRDGIGVSAAFVPRRLYTLIPIKLFSFSRNIPSSAIDYIDDKIILLYYNKNVLNPCYMSFTESVAWCMRKTSYIGSGIWITTV